MQLKGSDEAKAPKSCSIDTATNISSDSHLSREEDSSFSGQIEQNFREIK